MRARRRWAGPLGAVVATLVAACGGGPPAHGPAGEPLPFTNEGRIAAMISIHARAFWPDQLPPGIELRTASLDQAVALLKDDPDPFAVSRRRRAIAKLAAYGLGRPEIDAALEELGANLGALRHAFEGHSGILGPRPAFAEPPETLVLGPGERESAAYDLHANLSIPNCQTKRLLNWVGSIGASTVATSSVWVQREVGDVAKALDPQAWDECSKFFDHTYLARKDPSGVVEVPMVPFGTPYSTPTLFERFQCATTGCDAWFENLLYVTTWYETPGVGQTKYAVSYGFNECLDGQVLKKPRKIIADDGDLWARQDPAGGTNVEVSKTIAFDSAGLTGIAEAALAHSEMAGELAELVCCGVGIEPPVLPVVKDAGRGLTAPH